MLISIVHGFHQGYPNSGRFRFLGVFDDGDLDPEDVIPLDDDVSVHRLTSYWVKRQRDQKAAGMSPSATASPLVSAPDD